MAKRKTPKVANLRAEKVSEEQLKQIQTIVSNLNKAQFELGGLDIQKHKILHYLAGLEDEMKLTQNKLQEEYGTFDVNVQTGELNYESNGEADKKD